MAGDDSQDDGERTRIGGLPPGIPKPAQAPAAPVPGAPAVPGAAAEEPAERTVIAPARPPGVPPIQTPPTAPAPAAAVADDPGERTTIAPARPPGTPAAAAAPAPAREGGDRTQVLAAPPPGAARPAPPPAAPPPAAPAAPPPAEVTVGTPAGHPSAPDDEERTVVLAPRKVESTMRLERVAPKGEAETVVLDRPSLLLGRGHGCDVKLRTPTASREHAKIFFRNGQWMIAGVEGKSFHVDGARQTGGEVALRGGMRLRLGDDEFEVMDTTAGGAPSRSGGGLWARITGFVRGLFGRRT